MALAERTVVLLKPEVFDYNKLVETLSLLLDIGDIRVIAIEVFDREVRPVPWGVVGKHYPDTREWKESLGNNTFKAYQERGLDPKDELSTDDPAQYGGFIRLQLIEYFHNGTLWAILIEGEECIARVREKLGPADPSRADPETTIRGRLGGPGKPGADSYEAANATGRIIRNWIHASDGSESAAREIAIWFPAFVAQEAKHGYKRASGR